MLDKCAKSVLNTLIENKYTYPQASFTSLTDSLLPLLSSNGKTSWTYESLSSCVKYLIDHEYAAGEEFYHGAYPVPDFSELHVTYKGLNHNKFFLLQLREDLFKSVLLPIIVALLTSLITTAIGYMWSMNNSNKWADINKPATSPIKLDMRYANVP